MAAVNALSRRRSSFLAAAGLVLAGLACPRVAAAEDVAKARKLFADGVHQYQVGDYEGALRLFREANAEHHAPAIIYNVGLAEEKLGHRQAAVDAYEAYIAESGEKAEFTSAAVAAVAQLRATSTKLRIDSKPPGAHVFVDGTAQKEPSPVTLLVAAGHHIVVVQGDGWRWEKAIDTVGGEATILEAEAPPPAPPPPSALPPVAPPPDLVSPPPPPPPKPVEPAAPDQLVWGAAFAIAPAVMLGVAPVDSGGGRHANTKDILTVLAGPLLEIGYALTERIEFLGRGLVGIGPDGKPSFMYMGGPGLSFNVGPLWAGATFVGGRIDSARASVTYSTDLVFGVIGEVALRVLRKPYGEWLVSVQPSFLLTERRNDNTTLFVPLAFGYRAY